ncbi:putative HAD-superfamily hydrolase (Subfamily IA protein) [Desulfamplus magnetovallimortis]|uniref:phosphoglycolate phosphatase n=1 Tax=Desulfamplus magnetovallimortis TaxID=1246637 RepID=A0A1W1HA15_9BACT|nr:HAD-IA family hydrolase [Desulfamplus magnetovallimortis]SLM29283.1 putative HAD-superfamily hydrolase (Subfamily IA protein) [Desulfamplus magnetovallimortis]
MTIEIDNIKAVVFDCDGVLFDTAKANRNYYDTLLSNFGKPKLSDEQFVKVHMFTVREAFQYLFPEMESLEPIFAFAKKMGYHPFIKYMEREPGTRRLLTLLKSHGYIRAIATNRTNTMHDVLIKHGMTSFFEMVVTAADVENAKPAPDELVKIMNELSLLPRQILFIGDSEYDQQAAQNAGTWFAAFKNSSLSADFYAESMDSLVKLMKMK